MENGGAADLMSLELAKPVEIHDFVATFFGLGVPFERFLRSGYPELEGEVKVFVTDVRKGSMEAVMAISYIYPQIITVMDHLLISTDFETHVAKNITAFRSPGGRVKSVNKSELSEIVNPLMATANDPNGRASIKAVWCLILI